MHLLLGLLLLAVASANMECVSCPTHLLDAGTNTFRFKYSASSGNRVLFYNVHGPGGAYRNWGHSRVRVGAEAGEAVMSFTWNKGPPPLGNGNSFLIVREYLASVFDSPRWWRKPPISGFHLRRRSISDAGLGAEKTWCPDCPTTLPFGTTFVPVEYNTLLSNRWLRVSLYEAGTNVRVGGGQMMRPPAGNHNATVQVFVGRRSITTNSFVWKHELVYGGTTIWLSSPDGPAVIDQETVPLAHIECLDCPASILPTAASVTLTLSYRNAPGPLKIGITMQHPSSSAVYGEAKASVDSEHGTVTVELDITRSVVLLYGPGLIKFNVWSMARANQDVLTPVESTVRLWKEDVPVLIQEVAGITMIPYALTWPAGTTMREFQVVLSQDPGKLTTVYLDNGGYLSSALSHCFLVFDAQNWNVPQTVYLTSLPTAHATDQFFHIKAATTFSEMTTDLAVTQTPIPSSICHSSGDPHFRNFDGERFDYQGIGDHYLVRSPTLNIQARMLPCNGGRVTCNYGFVIKSGDGVVSILLDPITNIPKLELLSTVTGGMSIKSLNGRYTITTRDGAVLSANLFRRRGRGEYRMNGAVTLPGSYYQIVDGLCGRWNDQKINDGGQANWKVVDPGHSLFYFPWGDVPFDAGEEEKLPNFAPLECKGNKNTLVQTPATMTSTPLEFTEDLTVLLLKTHTPVTEQPPVVVFDPTYQPLDVDYLPEPTPEVKSICEDLYLFGPLAEACSAINVATQPYYDACVLDATLMEDTSMAGNAQAVLLAECQLAITTEVAANQDSPGPNFPINPGEVTWQQTLDAIEQIEQACPGACTSNGDCVNGTCVCTVDWGGADCSLATNSPPVLVYVTPPSNDGTVAVGDTIAIAGFQFEACPGLRCLFIQDGNQIASNGSIVSSALATCDVPEFPAEGALEIRLDYTCAAGQLESLENNNDLTFVIRPPPPLVEAYATNNGFVFCVAGPVTGNEVCFRSPDTECTAWPTLPVTSLVGVDSAGVIYGQDKAGTYFRSVDDGKTWWVDQARSDQGMGDNLYLTAVVKKQLGDSVYTFDEHGITTHSTNSDCHRSWKCDCV